MTERISLIGPVTTYLCQKNNDNFVLLIGDKHDERLSPSARERANLLVHDPRNVYNYWQFFEKLRDETVVLFEYPLLTLDFERPHKRARLLHTLTQSASNDKVFMRYPMIDMVQSIIFSLDNLLVIPVDARFLGMQEFKSNFSAIQLLEYLFQSENEHFLKNLDEHEKKLLARLKQQVAQCSHEKEIYHFLLENLHDKYFVNVHSLLIEIYCLTQIFNLSDSETKVVMLGGLHIEHIKQFLEYDGWDVFGAHIGEEDEQITIFPKDKVDILKTIFFKT